MFLVSVVCLQNIEEGIYRCGAWLGEILFTMFFSGAIPGTFLPYSEECSIGIIAGGTPNNLPSKKAIQKRPFNKGYSIKATQKRLLKKG